MTWTFYVLLRWHRGGTDTEFIRVSTESWFWRSKNKKQKNKTLLSGLEPATFRSAVRRSTHWATGSQLPRLEQTGEWAGSQIVACFTSRESHLQVLILRLIIYSHWSITHTRARARAHTQKRAHIHIHTLTLINVYSRRARRIANTHTYFIHIEAHTHTPALI